MEDSEPKVKAIAKKSGHNPDKNRKISSIKLNHETRQKKGRRKSKFLCLILSLWIYQVRTANLGKWFNHGFVDDFWVGFFLEKEIIMILIMYFKIV